MLGIGKLESGTGGLGGSSIVSLRIQFGRISIDGIRHCGQFIAQSIIDGQLAAGLPVVKSKEPVAPLGYQASNLSGIGLEVGRQAEDKIGRRVTGKLTRKVKTRPRELFVAERPVSIFRNSAPNMKL